MKRLVYAVILRSILSASSTIRRTLSLGLAIISAAALLFMMLSVTVGVAARILQADSFAGIIEYNEVALVVFVFGSLAYAQRYRAHVASTFVVRLLPAHARQFVIALGLTVAFLVVSWITWATAPFALHSLEIREYRFGVAQVPIWPAKVMMFVGLFALSLELLASLRDGISNGFAVEDAPTRDRY